MHNTAYMAWHDIIYFQLHEPHTTHEYMVRASNIYIFRACRLQIQSPLTGYEANT